MAAENFIDCDCESLISIKTSHIEVWDRVNQVWKQMYPPFRLYNDPNDVELATLIGSDGRTLLLQAGCPVRIDGQEFTNFNDVRDAIQTLIVDFFFDVTPVSAFYGGLYADRPTEPILWQMYFASDLGVNGYPIWWNGTIWVNAASAEIIVP